MSLRVLSGADVAELLSPGEGIELMDGAMRAWSSDRLSAPVRSKLDLHGNAGQLLIMPAAGDQGYGVKLASLHPANARQGRPVIQGLLIVFDQATGEPAALIDALSVTAMRTAAASALATRELARADASSHGILGTGPQAVSHAHAISQIRDIADLVIWGRDEQKAATLVRRLLNEGMPARVADDVGEAAACDIVSSVTSASEPILHGHHVRAGAHINLVGSHAANVREADSDVMSRADVYVDSLEAMKREAGDVLIPLQQGAIKPQQLHGEIGQLLLGSVPGRASDQAITVYKSVGIAAQDLWVGQHLLGVAERAGIGALVTL